MAAERGGRFTQTAALLQDRRQQDPPAYNEHRSLWYKPLIGTSNSRQTVTVVAYENCISKMSHSVDGVERN